jgi:lysophospholipase L1-like esterase
VRGAIGGNDTPAPSGTMMALDELDASAFGKAGFAAGDVIWLLQEYDYPAINGALPITDGTGAASSGVTGEGVYFGGATSIGASGTLVAGGGTAQLTRMNRPLLVLGRHDGVAVAAIGDSIPFGKNVANPTNDGSTSGGYPARAAYAAGVALAKICRAGTTTAQFTLGTAPIRLSLMPYFTHVWFALGFNDINPGGDQAAATNAAIDTGLGLIRAANGGIRIQLQAITIRTNAGSGTSTAGQTVSTGYAAGGASERGIVNAHLATLVGSNGVVGVTDLTGAMADATATDKWFIDAGPTNNYATSDGAHPTQAMDGLMATAAQPVIAGFTI